MCCVAQGYMNNDTDKRIVEKSTYICRDYSYANGLGIVSFKIIIFVTAFH